MEHVDGLRCAGPFHRANRLRHKTYLFIFLVPGKIILYILLVPYRTSGAPIPVHQNATQHTEPSQVRNRQHDAPNARHPSTGSSPRQANANRHPLDEH